MAKLTDADKQARRRQRMLAKAREYTVGTYSRKFVAPLFQKMIRAEWGSRPDDVTPAIVDGELTMVRRRRGQCVCVTCGAVKAWDGGIKELHTGHFLASRRNSILFEEDNVAPQCASCNYYRNGAPQAFRAWMLACRGEESVQRLHQLKFTVAQFSREDLVDMRIRFADRLKIAEERMMG